MIAYSCGVFDILRGQDLQDLDQKIQLSKKEGVEAFGVGVYENELCDNLGFNTPLKSLEDRMEIMKNVIGVDFVFSVNSLHPDILKNCVKNGYKEYKEKKNLQNSQIQNKKYKLGYAPGTYDLFHAGHLENLLIANRQCDKLIVGIKSDDLVREHKGKDPIMTDDERMEILRHFKFVYDAYVYYTRDLHIADDYFKAKYKQSFDAVFFGTDLKQDFGDVKDFNIVFTPRSKEKMKKKSTTTYRKLYVGKIDGKFTDKKENSNLKQLKTEVKNNDELEEQENNKEIDILDDIEQ